MTNIDISKITVVVWAFCKTRCRGSKSCTQVGIRSVTAEKTPANVRTGAESSRSNTTISVRRKQEKRSALVESLKERDMGPSMGSLEFGNPSGLSGIEMLAASSLIVFGEKNTALWMITSSLQVVFVDQAERIRRMLQIICVLLSHELSTKCHFHRSA